MENLESENHTALFFEGALVPEIQWSAPELLERELGEIFRTAEHFAENPKERTDLALRIFEALSSGEPEELSDEVWRTLENTDSYRIQRGDFTTVRELARANNRDFDFYRNRIVAGEPVPMPTIAVYKGIAHNIGGNTRLMFARVLGVRPNVVVARLEAKDALARLPDVDMAGFQTLVEVYEMLRRYTDRQDFEQALDAFPEGSFSDDEIRIGRQLADVYYGFERPPTLEAFTEKAHEVGVL